MTSESTKSKSLFSLLSRFLAAVLLFAGVIVTTPDSTGSIFSGALTDLFSGPRTYSRQLDSRKPAMMRLIPRVVGGKFVSRAEAAVLAPATSTRPELSLGLASRSNDFSRGTDPRHIKRVRELGINFGQILPSHLSPVTDAGSVSAQIFDHSVSAFFKNDAIKNSFVGRTAETVEKKMKAEVELGGVEPDSLKHNIKFQVKASETKASMEYRGLMSADLSYSIGSQRTNFEIHEELSELTNLVYSHVNEPNDRRDILSLRMNW